jgi:hypothetical protein
MSRLIWQIEYTDEQPHYVVQRGESTVGLSDLRGLLAAIRSAGD